MLKLLAHRLSRTQFAQTAIKDQADLETFKQKPSMRIIVGLVIIGISYTIGWPAVGALGVVSMYLEEPLILAIGGPVVYGFSHLVFILGAYLAGADYAKAFFRWSTRVLIERFMGHPKDQNPKDHHPPEPGV